MRGLAEIRAALDAGGVVLLPTETVYGLAARADRPEAISRLYAIKGRDFDKPLAICVRDLVQAESFGEFDATSRALAERYWPGPLTLVLRTDPGTGLDPRTQAGTEDAPTIALRCPVADWRDIVDVPLALTSANRSGAPDLLDFDAAMEELGDEIDAALPASAPLKGLPSTIVEVNDGAFRVLRQGPLVVTGVLT